MGRAHALGVVEEQRGNLGYSPELEANDETLASDEKVQEEGSREAKMRQSKMCQGRERRTTGWRVLFKVCPMISQHLKYVSDSCYSQFILSG